MGMDGGVVKSLTFCFIDSAVKDDSQILIWTDAIKKAETPQKQPQA
jgi:hypothetical protein